MSPCQNREVCCCQFKNKNLAIFDLDNTLLKGDSDYYWGEFLVKKGLVDKKIYSEANQKFYTDYKNGCLDIKEFSEFVFAVLKKYPLDLMTTIRDEYVKNIIQPMITKRSYDLVKKHRDMGDFLMIITATNSFITSKIAQLFKIENLLATDPEFINGKFTGKLSGTACFGEGKLVRLNQFLKNNPINYDKSYFYSDSINDLPMLQWADIAIATNPDERLKTIALLKKWQIIKTYNNNADDG
ncbi:MAG: HAD-IB family hydrolase [Gammaproteobacteria bacterium]|nr:MAG: HAD-IB family hydrolase [Gammaproteobacteria bacterium]